MKALDKEHRRKIEFVFVLMPRQATRLKLNLVNIFATVWRGRGRNNANT